VNVELLEQFARGYAEASEALFRSRVFRAVRLLRGDLQRMGVEL
jgi:hypothetical protein